MVVEWWTARHAHLLREGCGASRERRAEGATSRERSVGRLTEREVATGAGTAVVITLGDEKRGWDSMGIGAGRGGRRMGECGVVECVADREVEKIAGYS